MIELLHFRAGGLRSALARRNLRFNRQFEISGPVNGQGLPPVKDMRYGITDMARAGCGLIAMYNALLLLNNPQRLSEVAAWGELYACRALGLLGTSPRKAKRLFLRLGYTVSAVYDEALFDSRAKSADVCLFTYWNRRGRPLQGMHTVCVRCLPDALEVYNRSDLSPALSRRASFRKWAAEGIGPVVLYCISK